jgi:hypothetical protein
MLKTLLPLFLFASAAFAADPVVPPAPPECLTRPVTLGSVTITCTVLDVSSTSGVTAPGWTFPDGYLFQVNATSTDPDVIGFRFGFTWQVPTTSATTPPDSVTEWGTVGKVVPLPSRRLPAFSGYRYTFVVGAGYPVTSIQVQELKAASSQTF